MTETLVTKDNKTNREIATPMPDCLTTESLGALVGLVGEDLVHKAATDQFTIKFRAHIRGKLAATDDNGDPVNTDEKILAEDYADWRPEIRTRMTAEEKAMKALSELPPEVAAAVLANYRAQ